MPVLTDIFRSLLPIVQATLYCYSHFIYSSWIK